ncbi:TIGR04255 family protein [Methanospirillum lacunae]|uniref:TIGR04255 family protein n=1 Tax=Methanospirillum lacunae TaxID=668570 RepID=A0A2V2N1Y1_9EURY|nr:TIGR04255 family protein [Methanospirillum lacunae]PWR72640.1 hypothetical protein DK846_06650 [Methanospirillum lacunae]
MNPPLPHNFSRSPVEEVCCSLELITQPILITVAPPYPGWGSIKTRLTDEITGLRDINEVTRCSLQYRDRFLLDEDGFSRIINEIKSDLFHINQITGIEFMIIPIIQRMEHQISVRTRYEVGDHPSWILIFNLQTYTSFKPETPADILSWFDKAHAIIHTLFDQIVPEEIIELIK